MTNFSDIEKDLTQWLLEAAFWIGAVVQSRSDVRPFNSLNQVSAGIRMRWFSPAGTFKLQLCGTPDGQRLGVLPHGILEFTVTAQGAQFEDFQQVEDSIKRLLPDAQYVKCQHCEARLGVREIEGVQTCGDCIPITESDDKSGYVYLYGNQEYGFYKIGYSKTPKVRAAALGAIKLPFECKILHTFPASDGRGAERTLNADYAEYRTNGEWFNLSCDQVSFFQSIERWQWPH